MIKKLQSIRYLLSFLLLILSIAGCNVDQAALTKAAGVAGLLDLGSLTIASGNNQSTLQNTLATQSLEVLALDIEGNAKSGVSIKFQIVTANGGSLDDQGTSKTVSSGVDGKASVTYRSASSLGEVIILATSSGGNVSFTQIVTDSSSSSSGASGSTLLIVKGNNQTVEENSVASEDLEVLALNSLGAPLENTDITFAIYTTIGGTLSSSAVTSKVVTTSSTGKASVSFNALARMGATTVIATSSAGSAAFSVNVVAAGSTGLSSSGSTLLIVKGNNQTLEQNTTASDDFEVIALNSSGSPMSGVSVAFQVYTASAGTLTGAVTSKNVTTGSDGKASVAFSASSRLGAATVVATSSAGSAAFTANVVATGSATTTPLGSTLLMLKGNNLVIEQNTTTSLEVLALNSAGVPMADTDITFEVLTTGSISNPQPTAGTATGTGLAAKTGSNGRASVTFTAPSSLGTATIIARSGAGSVAFNLSVGITGIGSILSISNGNGQVIVPNTLASQDLEVIATSASGSPLSGITVTFTVTTTNGGVLSNSQGILVGTTDANGKASTTFTSSNTSGPISVLASSSVGSVTFALNTTTSGSGGSGGTISFNPSTYSPASGSWLNTNVGAAPSKSVTVTNTASYGLYINSIFTTTSTPFTIVSDTCPRSPTPLATTESCTVVISYSPTSSTTSSKFVFLNWSSLNDGSNGQNAVLALEGSGPPALTFVGISSIDNITTTSLRINWAAATGGTVSQYRVYRIISGVPTLLATLSSSTLTYSISALTQNTSYTYRVRAVNTANEEDGNANDVSALTDTSPVPVLTDVGHFVFPTNPVYASGTALTLDFNKTNTTPVGDTGMAYTCKYSRQVTGTLVGKSNCTLGSLGGTYSLDAATGAFSWLPKLGTQGVFEFALSGTDLNGTGVRYFTVNVAHPYASPNLATILADFRASFSALTQTNTASANRWSDISGANNYGTVSSGTPLWNGSINNTTTDPQKVTFGGSTEIDLGATLSGYTSFMLDFWMSNPESTFTNGSTVMKMDDSSTDNGFKITQNTLENGQRALRIDFDRSYRRKILSDYPVAYWRMDELSGSSISDAVDNNSLTVADTSNTATTSNVVYSLSGATLGETTSTAMSIHTNRILLPNVAAIKPATNFSVEMWVKYPYRTQPTDHDLYNFSTTSVASGFSMSIISGVLTVKYKPASAAVVTLTQNPNSLTFGNLFDSNWHHLVFTGTSNNKVLYLDGMILASDTTNNGAVSWPATPNNFWVTSGADSTNPVQIDEVAVYNTALTGNQVLNHLSTGDHFVPKQTYYPANTQLQSRPEGLWRFGEAWDTQQVAQDYSGNQADAINWNAWNYYTAQGPYVRTGGSGLDLTGATYYPDHYTDQDYVSRVTNSRHLSFDQKFTISEWVNFSFTGNDRHFAILNTRNLVTGINNYGISIYANNQGKIVVGFSCTYSVFCANQVATTSSVVPTYTNWAGAGSLNTNLRSGWTHLAITFDGTQPAANRVQVYVHGVAVKMAAPIGTIPSSLSTLTGPINSYTAYDWQLNGIAGQGRQLNTISYPFADFALYGRALNASEIRAQAYEGSLRYCDIPVTSNLQDPSNSKPFDYISMLFNVVQSSGQLQIYRNSKLECAIRPGANLTAESLSLALGASSNGFKGHITDLRLHGSSTNTVATITNTHKAFMNSADQHRVVAVGNIATDNLVRAYEPATAMDGMRPYSSGNEDAKIFWQENGNLASGTRQEPGYLRSFSGYTGKWNGTGIPTDPYRVTFDGNGWIDLGTTPLFETSTKNFTVCMWEKTTQTGTYTFFHKGNTNTQFGNFAFGTYGGTQVYVGINGSYWYYPAAYNTIKNGLWHYLCAMTDGSNVSFWLDGVNQGNNAFTSAISANAVKGGDRMGLGYHITRRYESNNYGGVFVGDMGGVHIYNGALTTAQIKANCAAQAANYNMSTCAP